MRLSPTRSIINTIVIGFCSVLTVSAQWETDFGDDDRCQTPTRQPGRCIPIRSCSYIINLLDTSPRPLSPATAQLLQSFHCGFLQSTPLVCCPDSPTTPITPTTTTLIGSDRDNPPDVSNHRNINLINPAQCGLGSSDRVIGGNTTLPFEYPWMALIGYKTRNGLGFRCGGTLINQWYVLTAAHCVVQLEEGVSLAGVRLGEQDMRTEFDCNPLAPDDCAPAVQDVFIAESIPHPMYNRRVLQHDIALIRLAAPAKLDDSIRPICLPTGALRTETLEGKIAIVAGWGATEKGFSSPDLLKVDLPIVPRAECQRRYNEARTPIPITAQQLCAGGLEGKDSCSGDSGGPLVYTGRVHEDSRFVQFGIVSFGPVACGQGNQPGVYTRITHYMPWILDNIKP